jgi:hypothetical protein
MPLFRRKKKKTTETSAAAEVLSGSPRPFTVTVTSMDDEHKHSDKPPSPISASASGIEFSETREGDIDVALFDRDRDFRPSVVAPFSHSDPILSVQSVRFGIDRHGFPSDKPETETETRTRMRMQLKRGAKWRTMLYKSKEGAMHTLSGGGRDRERMLIEHWNSVKGHRKLKSRIRKGIPMAFRGDVWPNLCGARERRLEECERYGSTKLYRDLVEDERSPEHDQIWKDINRTFREQVRFGAIGLASKVKSTSKSASEVSRTDSMGPREVEEMGSAASRETSSAVTAKSTGTGFSTASVVGEASVMSSASVVSTSAMRVKHEVQDTDIPPSELYKHATEAQMQLYNVLKAFSLFRSDIGYCQGMQSVTALMLMHMTEEDAFWVLASLADDPKYGMEWLWRPSMPGIGLKFYQMQRLVRIVLPKLARHFERNMIIDPSMYQASQWFITVFLATEMKFDLILNIWDVYLNEGMKSIFRFGLALLKYYEKQLLACDMEDMLMMFRSAPAELETQRFMDSAWEIKITHSQLAALERHYDRSKAKEAAASVIGKKKRKR